jgi:hypothetical protein
VPNVASGFPAMAASKEYECVESIASQCWKKKRKGEQAKISHQETILLSI